MLKASRGYVQGYNAQAAVDENQIVITGKVTVDSPDFGHLQPMPDAGKRKGTRPGWDGGAYAHMRRVLSTELGRALYRKRRKAMVEPVFAQTKHNRRINQFQRRGRSAARSEWRLITATHNLMKLHKHQLAAQAA